MSDNFVSILDVIEKRCNERPEFLKMIKDHCQKMGYENVSAAFSAIRDKLIVQAEHTLRETERIIRENPEISNENSEVVENLRMYLAHLKSKQYQEGMA